MKTGRAEYRLALQLPTLFLLVLASSALAWDPYAVDPIIHPTMQAPLAGFQHSGAVDPPMEWDMQKRRYVPGGSRDGNLFGERLPVGTFRPMESAHPAPEWNYQGYNFRPLGPELRRPRPVAAPPKAAGILPGDGGGRTSRSLSGSRRYEGYGNIVPRYSFRPEWQAARQRKEGHDPLDPIQPPLGIDYPGGFQEFPATGYYEAQSVGGPQGGRW